MKYLIFLAVTIWFSTQIYCQNIALTKTIDNTIKLPGDYVNTLGEYITYKKVFGDQILRMELNKVQLLDADFDKQWEVNLETVKSVGGDNYYFSASGDNYIYIIQFGAAYVSANVISKLTQIDRAGNVKSILLSDIIEMRGVNGLKVIDDKLYLGYSRTTGSLNPYTKKLEIFSSTIVIDADLKPMTEPFDLPFYAESSNYNLVWSFIDDFKDSLMFRSYYFLDPKGEYSGSLEEGSEQFEMTIIMDQNNTLVSSDKRKLAASEQFRYTSFHGSTLKYDKKIYTVLADNLPLSILRQPNACSSLTINSNGKESPDIIARFFEITQLHKKVVTTFNGPKARLIDVITDPLNNSLNVVLISEMGARYVLTLDENFDLVFIQEYKTCYKPYNFHTHEEAFTNGFAGASVTWGTKPTGHIPNAFDFMMTLDEKCQFTIINYSDYQVLATDNRVSKETKFYKIVK